MAGRGGAGVSGETWDLLWSSCLLDTEEEVAFKERGEREKPRSTSL